MDFIDCRGLRSLERRRRTVRPRKLIGDIADRARRELLHCVLNSTAGSTARLERLPSIETRRLRQQRLALTVPLGRAARQP